MAGFIFTYKSRDEEQIKEEIKAIFNKGTFGTNNSPIPNVKYSVFCDYLSMKPGDNVYFFCKRNIYGIGELVKIKGEDEAIDCKYWSDSEAKTKFLMHKKGVEKSISSTQVNEDSNIATPESVGTEATGVSALMNTDSKIKNQEIKTGERKVKNKSKDKSTAKIDEPYIEFSFTYDTQFYNQGNDKEPVFVDMDDILNYKSSSFNSLRFFSSLSFIKINEEENRALKEFFYLSRELKKQAEETNEKEEGNKTIFSARAISKEDESRKIEFLKARDIRKIDSKIKGQLSSEMMLEAYVMESILKNQKNITEILGDWDYVSHQVVASPYKPAQYADYMDVFCIRYLKEKGVAHVPCGFLILELKKGSVYVTKDEASKEKDPVFINDTVSQIMKYVDWVCKEYAHGDYRLIKAAIIAKNYSSKIDVGKKRELREMILRHTMTGTHPVRHESWCDVSLISYNIDDEDNIIYDLDTDFKRLENSL